MNAARKILIKASRMMELPSDIVAFLPKIELTGTEECSIEPHKGLLEYEQNRICVATSIGTAVIQGDNLRIKRMNHQRITLAGHVLGVMLQEEPGE